MRYSLLLPISEEALQTLESHLATRTFILGTSLTLADLTLFGALHQAVVWHHLYVSDQESTHALRAGDGCYLVLFERQ